MKNIVIASALAFASTIAVAAPVGVDTTVSYRNDKAVQQEGVEANVSYSVMPELVVGATVFADSDDLVSYGAHVGSPVKIKSTNIVVTPYIGYERYDEAKVSSLNAGVKAFAPVFAKNTGVTADVKVIEAVGENRDSLDQGDDYSFSIGLTQKF